MQAFISMLAVLFSKLPLNLFILMVDVEVLNIIKILVEHSIDAIT